MLTLSRCTDLPDIAGDAASCIQYKGYKRTHDGDPPCELSSRNVKWVKRHYNSKSADEPCSWALKITYVKADGETKEVHKTPAYFEDRRTFTHACVHPHVRGQCSRRCTVPPHLAILWQFARSDPEDHDKYYDSVQMLSAELQAVYDREHHTATDSLGSSALSGPSSLPVDSAPAAAPEAEPEAPPEAAPEAAHGEALPASTTTASAAPPASRARPPEKRQVSLIDFMRSAGP